MRIIAGDLKGREFRSPPGHRTHPMSDKMRGAIFNVLGDIEGLTILDAFTGSGAMALEAVSRGARFVTAVDIDKNAVATAKTNVLALGVKEAIKVMRANVSTWSDNNPNQVFDIVLCDPPYTQLQPRTLMKLTRHVSETGLFVMSWPGKETLLELEGFQMVAGKRYGDAQAVFYKYSAT